MPSSPIVLFAYNRPEHTKRCLASLSRNPRAATSELYIHIDGPKPGASAADIAQINAVRAVARAQQWCGTVRLIEPSTNRTMPVALTQTVSELIQQFGSLVILEDDLVLSEGFLEYVNQGLDLYSDDEKVMAVEGYQYPIGEEQPTTCFLGFTATWGWATWARAWSKFNPSPDALVELISKKSRARFNIENSYNFYELLLACKTGSWKYWDIRWYGSVFANEGLCLFPSKSLVRNIGHDHSGMHCLDDRIFQTQQISGGIPVVKKVLEEDSRTRAKIVWFLRRKKLLDLGSRFRRKIAKAFRRW